MRPTLLTIRGRSLRSTLTVMADRARVRAMCIGLVIAGIFAGLTTVKLQHPGVYYDELHQAPAAFHYVGKHPDLFVQRMLGVPILNMSYSGAIKSAVYGVYLRVSGAAFQIVSWRLLGIVFVAAGILVLYAAAPPAVPWQAHLVFGILLVTDAAVLLTTRHDWGPTALALALRLLLVAAWLSIEYGKPSNLLFGLSGLLVGIAIFEKLSSIVLLAPLGLLLATSRKRGKTAFAAAALGLAVGAGPLLLVNFASYRSAGLFVSLAGLDDSGGAFRIADAPGYVFQLLSLGQGTAARELILGGSGSPLSGWLEAALMLSALAIVAATALRSPAGAMAASYAAIGALVFLLPKATFVHHWVLGTPFQYCAIALALGGRLSGGSNTKRNILGVVLAALVLVRVMNLAGVEKELAGDTASASFAPSFSRLMEIAGDKSDEAVFIAADWGTATQLYCGSNGQDGFVFEPYWNADPSKAVQELLARVERDSVYVVTAGLSPRFAEASEEILAAMAGEPQWAEVPVEPEFSGLDPVRARKFVRRR